jgi:Ca-activated chloride channel family protein
MRWLFVLLVSPAFALSPQAVQNNNAAVSQFENKNYYPAYQGFLRGLAKEPFTPLIHLNLGRAYQQNEEYDKALQEYDVIQRLPGVDRDTQFKAYFNSGTVAASQNKIPEALDYYQKALAIDPQSVETKTNIELLWQGGGGKGKSQGKPDKDKDNKDNKDSKDNKDNKDNKDKDKDKDKKPDQERDSGEEPPKQPQKFESQNLSPEDVRKILDEIKNQEQQIRAEINKKEVKETPREKNW